jgi:stage III sporulation protein AA
MALEIVKIFPVHIREALANDTWKAGLEEIRVRVGSPLEFIYGGAATCRGGRARMHCLLPADMRTAIG